MGSGVGDKKGRTEGCEGAPVAVGSGVEVKTIVVGRIGAQPIIQ